MVLLFFKHEAVSIPQIFASETYYQSIIIAYCWFSDQIALNLDWIQFLTNFKLRSPTSGVEQHPGGVSRLIYQYETSFSPRLPVAIFTEFSLRLLDSLSGSLARSFEFSTFQHGSLNPIVSTQIPIVLTASDSVTRVLTVFGQIYWILISNEFCRFPSVFTTVFRFLAASTPVPLYLSSSSRLPRVYD